MLFEQFAARNAAAEVKGDPTTKPPPRTPKPRRNNTGGAFSGTCILTVNDAPIINLGVRGQLTFKPP